jgi:hypothetical protein
MEKLRKALGTLEHTYTRDDGEVNFVITLMPSAIFEHDGQEVIDA